MQVQDRTALGKLVELRRSDDPYEVFKWSLVSPEHRFVWVIVPKVACITTTLLLRELIGNPHRGVSMWEDEGLQKLRDFDTDQVVEMLTSKDWFRFGFVRNPYDRLFSAYKSKIGNPLAESFYQEVQKEIRKEYDYPLKGHPPAARISFRDFVRYVLRGARPTDGHWCVQSERLALDLIPYDFIGRFEEFPDHLREVLGRLNASEELISRASDVHNATPKIWLAAAYDREMADAVYDMYQADFEAFEYSRDSWMSE